VLNANDKRVYVGDRRLNLRCIGKGQPTVIFEAGMGDTIDTWTRVQPIIAQETCTVSYDRAGLGESEPVPQPRVVSELVNDLCGLLELEGIRGPYIMVGHSFGAQLARLFATRQITPVVGMILIDPSHEDKYARFEQVLTEDLIIRQNNFVADPTRNPEGIDLLRSRAELRKAAKVLAVPMVILTRGLPDPPSSIWPSAQIQEIEAELQEETLAFSSWPGCRRIIATESGHFIHHDQPDLVIAAIKDVINLVREI
jgi:pimeloyl-ACP methyl ester carboxylesterase